MRTFIIALIAIATVFMTVVPAQADNSEEVIIGVMGGVIGDLVLGEVLERPRYRQPAYVYEYAEEPVMVRECVTKYKRYYDSMGNWVRRPVKKCYWVERY